MRKELTQRPRQVFAKPYQVHMLQVMAVSGWSPSDPWLPELRRGLEPFLKIFQ
jgi:hypothetical protein